MTPLRDLDAPCGTCARPYGDHTLRELNVCMGTATTDLPFEAIPSDMARAAAESVRERFGLEPGVIVADHVTVKALTFGGTVGPVNLRFPCVLHEFQIGVPGGPPHVVATVAFIGNGDTVRGYGRLVRDSANGAANGAEGL